MVTVPASTLARYERFSLFNSPYPAHDRGCAVDLYQGSAVDAAERARSPVAGEVLDTRTVACPDRPYAAPNDHLVLVELSDPAAHDAPPGTVARMLHVDPAVAPGDRVAVGDHLGEMVRSGYFGQWVANHVHLGFRGPDANPYRAAGSLPLTLSLDVRPLDWDGTGTVVDVGPTHVRLDAPVHPDPGPGADRFCGLAADSDAVPGDGRTVLDGGLAHYAGGGTLSPAAGAVALLGTTVGDVVDGADGPDGAADSRDLPRPLAWRDVAVVANGRRATGLSLFASRVPFGAKVVFHEGHDLAVGDAVRVAVEPTDDPVRLG
jgi:hypothetical protein